LNGSFTIIVSQYKNCNVKVMSIDFAKRHLIVLFEASYHMSDAVAPPEIAVLITKLNFC